MSISDYKAIITKKYAESSMFDRKTRFLGKIEPKRFDIINYLISKHGLQSYLEVGFGMGTCFKEVKVARKYSVDPNLHYKAEGVTHVMTSDEAFKLFIKNGTTFDIIFIDGLHVSEQVNKDIENSLKVLNPKGFILLHDSLPCDKSYASSIRLNRGPWNGDVYKSLIKFRLSKKDNNIHIVDTDHGIGIIHTFLKDNKLINFSQEKLENFNDWNYYVKHRDDLLNVIKCDIFLKLF